MEIFVDGRKAVIKSGYSIDITFENWLFSGAETYSLEISFPLDVAENVAIFGHVDRSDVHDGQVLFSCEVRDRAVQLHGVLAVTGISDAELKGQFLEGRSVVNFDRTWDKLYINELDLGEWPEEYDPETMTPAAAWAGKDGQYMSEEVALPWVSGESGNIQNEAVRSGSTWTWHEDTKHLSCQPYLKTIYKRICNAVGYTPRMSDWSGKYAGMLVCNSLPEAWDIPQYARALPHWTVKEFFERLELFLGIQLIFDHRDKLVYFRKTSGADVTGTEHIDVVVDEFGADVDYEKGDTSYRPMRNIAYKECSHRMWKYYSCRWFVDLYRKLGKITEYADLSALMSDNMSYLSQQYKFDSRGSRFCGLLHAQQEDLYMTVVPYDRTWEANPLYDDDKYPDFMRGRWLYDSRLQILDDFGPDIVDDDPDAKCDTVEFVPAWIDGTDERGQCIFLDCGSWKEEEVETGDDSHDRFWIPLPLSNLERGDKEGVEEYFDRIYVGYWNGSRLDNSKFPHPKVYSYDISDDGTVFMENPCSFNLGADRKSSGVTRIDTSRRYRFSFISDRVPEVRALFIIRGKRYLCEKLTVTITEKGMSRLMKGEFRPVED